jgi:exopolysaccharide biosynthesis polyprenyl glycosylphosphotransferase
MTTASPSWAELEARLAVPMRGRTSTATPGRRAMHRYASGLMLTDCGVVLASLGLAAVVRFGTDDAALEVSGLLVNYWIVVVAIATTWIAGLAAFRTRDVRIIGSEPTEYRRVTDATAITFALDTIALLVIGADISRVLFLVAFPVGLTGLLLSRRLWRAWLMARRRRGRNTLATLIVGSRHDVKRVLSALADLRGGPFETVGVMLERPEGCQEVHAGRRSYPVLGTATSSAVADEARARGIDAVIVAGQPRGRTFLRDLGWSLERTEAEMLIASRLLNVAGPRIHIRPLDNLPLTHVELPSYEGAKHVLKRVFDIVASALALVLFAPAMLVIAAAIKLSDGGPVFFFQARVGRNGSLFHMIKFRSMVPDSEAALSVLAGRNDGNGVLFKLHDDPRVTRIGRLLRKYSLDELPQLLNVLVGEMSLVGPRPPLIDEVDKYEVHVLRRLYIKPGLTGMWQISGRSDLSWEESVRLDLYYVENWSLTGDLLILWRTVKVVLRPVGAY